MKLRIFSILFIAVFSTNAFSQTISTAAGTGVGGYSGDGGPAPASQLNGPYSVTVDSAGNLYIAEWYNHRIRRVSASTGVITTVAGNGFADFGGDGGAATSAYLNHPEDVAVDAIGNLYIADSLNNRIRKVSTDGTISTIAGTGAPGYNGEGYALSVQLNDPAGVAIDSSGNLYIADQSSHRIRKLILSTGAISTVAGTGIGGFSGDGGPATQAQINNPVHLALDAAGNLFIADFYNHRIRFVNMSTGVITTVAGSGPGGGQGGFSGDGGSPTSARLNTPGGIAVDTAGNLYIADTGNKRVRIVGNGVITTLAGGGTNGDGCSSATAALGYPLGVAATSSGRLSYIADYADNRVRLVTLSGTNAPPAITSVSPSSGFTGSTSNVTVTGTGFSTGGSGSGCTSGVATVAVSGTGVTASNVTVNSDTSVSVTLTIAGNASVGPRDLSVTNARGTSNNAQFTVNNPPIPPPTLTGISPSSGLRGANATVTLTGTNFIATSGATTVTASGTGISVSNVNVTSTTSLSATLNIAVAASLGNYGVTVSTGGGSSNTLTFTVNPPAPAFTFGLPQTLNPTQQTPVQLSIVSPSPDPVTGQLAMTFTPNAVNNANDPNVTLINAQTSVKTVAFTVPGNSTAAQLALSNLALQVGTVAGTVRLTLSGVQVGGQSVTPANSTYDITIPRLVPTITNVRLLNRTTAGFDVEITGYSTSRDITGASFQFTAAAGASLETYQLQPDVTSTFTTYYQSSTSTAAGSAFVYVQPFTATQGNANAVGTVAVAVSNAQGSSPPKTAQ